MKGLAHGSMSFLWIDTLSELLCVALMIVVKIMRHDITISGNSAVLHL